ncbi:MAG: hypothetical protein AAGA10_22510 [Bacteroidota bacterium]
MNLSLYIACLLSFGLGPLALQAQPETLLETNVEGKVIRGSKEHLITVIQEGYPIRVGWKLDLNQDGIADLEHWVDAEFISILEGEVFTQIETIYAQGPNLQEPQIFISNNSMKWNAIIGTNGKLVSRFIIEDLAQIENEGQRGLMEELSKVETMTVETIWVRN